jgi:hypothetical protein
MPRLAVSNIIDQPVYDTVQVPISANAQDIDFFQIQYGGLLAAGVPKGWNHTNLVQAGRLEGGHELEVTSLSWYFQEQATPAAQADIRLIQQAAMIFYISNQEFLKVPAALIPNGGAELVLHSNEVAAAGLYTMTRGHVVHQNRLMLVNPITILDQESFRVRFEDIAAGVAAVTNITFVLWGNYKKPVK